MVVSSIHEPRPSRSIEGWVTLCGVVSRQGVKRNVRVPWGRGLRIKIQQSRELPHFLLVEKYLEGFMNRGWTLFCGPGVAYDPQLAKASTPCGVVSTREKSVFVPGLLGLMGYGRNSETAVEPDLHRVRRNAPRPFAGLSPPRVSLPLRAARPLNDSPI